MLFRCLCGGVFSLIVSISASGLTTVTENFNSDPYWTSFNSTAVNDNYGYSPTTANAGGATGEAGGLFGRHDAFDSFYADTDLGGTLAAGTDLLQSSGKISIDTSLNPSFFTNISFFDQTNPTKGGNALRININNSGGVMLWLRLEIGKNLVSPVTNGLVDGRYTWTMNWNPTGSADGLGEGTVTFNGISPGTPSSLTAVLDIPVRNEPGNPEWLAEDIFFNAFGLQNYDGEATTSGQYGVFIDDVTYSTVTSQSTIVQWARNGSGVWTDSSNWNPGEVPNGNNRTAIFGANATQNTTVFTTTGVTVKSILFANTWAYAITGTAPLTLEAATGNASINSSQGDHQFQTVVNLASDTLVDASAGASISFNNLLDLAGNTLTISGLGSVNINNQLILGGGTLALAAGAPPLSLNGDAAILDGTLAVSASANEVVAGQTLDLLDFDTLGDTFDSVVLPELGGGLSWDTSSLYVDGTVTVVPEPAGLVAMVLGGLVAMGRRRRPGNARNRPGRVVAGAAALVAAILIAAPAQAAVIGQNFNTDPNWQGDDNVLPQGSPTAERDDFNNFRYRPDTSTAGGSAGEIGGYFGMNTFDSFYADTTLGGNVGGSFPLQQTLHASGKLSVNSDHGPTWNMNIGFFDQSDYTDAVPGVGDGMEGGSGDAIRFAVIEQSPDFRIRLEIRQQGNGYNGPVLAGPAGLLDGTYEWTMDYDPTGGSGGNGRLSLNMVGANTISTFVDVDINGKNIPMNLNAFGFTNYNSGISRPDFNKHYTFLDDLQYSTNEAADPIVEWASSGSGSWNTAYSWQRTSTTDGGGFVPDGNNRSAIFGGAIAQDSVVFVDADVAVKNIVFSNANSYLLAGTGTITLQSDTGSAAVSIVQGSHQFLAAVALANNAVVSVPTGSMLGFDNALDLGGQTMTLDGDGTVNVNNLLAGTAGTLNVNAGTLGGHGKVGGDLNNIATVAPGTSIGSLEVSGSFLQGATGTLAVEIESLTSFDQLQVTGGATLDGTIDIALLGGYVPSPGDEFMILSAAGVADLGLTLTGDTTDFSLFNNGTALLLRFGALAGDLDGDGFVGIADLNIVLGNWNQNVPPGDPLADPTGDGFVGIADLNVVLGNWNAGTPPTANVIPEPTTFVLLSIGGLVTFRRHRRI